MAFLLSNSGEVVEGEVLSDAQVELLNELPKALYTACGTYISDRDLKKMALYLTTTYRMERITPKTITGEVAGFEELEFPKVPALPHPVRNFAAL